MLNIKFFTEKATGTERDFIGSEFDKYNRTQSAPAYSQQHLKWVAYSADEQLVGILAAKLQ